MNELWVNRKQRIDDDDKNFDRRYDPTPPVDA